MLKAALLAVCLLPGVAGCALVQDAYDDRRIDECRSLPTPDEQRNCEREARDASAGIPPRH